MHPGRGSRQPFDLPTCLGFGCRLHTGCIYIIIPFTFTFSVLKLLLALQTHQFDLRVMQICKIANLTNLTFPTGPPVPCTSSEGSRFVQSACLLPVPLHPLVIHTYNFGQEVNLSLRCFSTISPRNEPNSEDINSFYYCRNLRTALISVRLSLGQP